MSGQTLLTKQETMRTCNILIFLVLIYTVAALKCVIKEKKSQEEPEIHVINLDDGNDDSREAEVISLQIPDRRKREVWDSKSKMFCKTDEDCEPGEKCIAYLRCIKATKREAEKEEIVQTSKL